MLVFAISWELCAGGNSWTESQVLAAVLEKSLKQREKKKKR